MLTPEDREQLAGLLAAAISKPPPPLSEKLGVAEFVRKWAIIIVLSISSAAITVYQIKQNTELLQDIAPKLKVMWWMKENGYTNKDVQPHGPIRPPEF